MIVAVLGVGIFTINNESFSQTPNPQIQVVSNTLPIQSGFVGPVQVQCPSGMYATGGGYDTNSDPLNVVYNRSTGGSPPTGWEVYYTFGTTPNNITVYAVCVDDPNNFGPSIPECTEGQTLVYSGSQLMCSDFPTSNLNFYTVEGNEVRIEYGVATHSIAHCDSGDEVLIGSFETIRSSGNYNVFPNTSKKLWSGEAWAVNFASNSALPNEWADMKALATCIDLEPLRP